MGFNEQAAILVILLNEVYATNDTFIEYIQAN